MANNVKIEISQIPAIFPDVDFKDPKYVKDYRVIKLPDAQSEIIKTKNKFKTVDNAKSRQILIQSFYYRKYRLYVNLQENMELDLIKVAGLVEITKLDDTVLKAEIIDIDYSKKQNTENYIVTIDFYDLTDDNKSINNYLISEHLLNVANGGDGSFIPNELNRLEFQNDKSSITEYTVALYVATVYTLTVTITDYVSTLTMGVTCKIWSTVSGGNVIHSGTVTNVGATSITITTNTCADNGTLIGEFTITWEATNAIDLTYYTKLEPKYYYSKPDVTTTELGDKRKIGTSLRNYKIMELHFFLNETERNEIEKFLRMVNPYDSNFNGYIRVYLAGTTYVYANELNEDIIELVERDDLTDIYHCIVKLPHLNQLYSHHAAV